MPGRIVLKKKSKYRAVKTVVDGITFASKKESKRWQELCLLLKAGEIFALVRQHAYVLEVKGVAIGKYVADFSYYEKEWVLAGPDSNWENKLVVEDCKGMKTPLYRWKKKHLEAQYGIKIRET